MSISKFHRWLPKSLRRTATPVRKANLALQSLEAREVPAVVTWDGEGATSNWSEGLNWNTNAIPNPLLDPALQIEIPAGVNTFQNLDFMTIDRLTLNGGSIVFLTKSLTFDGSAAGDQIISKGGNNTLLGAGGIGLTGTAPRFNVAGGTTLTFAADISGSASSEVQKDGDGTLELLGAATFTGNTHVRDGILALNDGDGLQATLPANSTLIIGDNNEGAGTAEVRILTTADEQLPDTLAVTINSDGFFNPGQQGEDFGALTLNGGFVSVNGGFIAPTSITANADGTIALTANGGELRLGTSNRTINVAAGKTLVISTQITGTGGIIKDGAGTLRIDTGFKTVSNTYTGTTTVKNGTLELDNNLTDQAFAGNLVIGDGVGAAGSAVVRLMQSQEIPNTSKVTVDSDGLLDLNAKAETIGPLTIVGGGQIKTNGATLGLAGDVTMPTSTAFQAFITGDVNLGTTGRNISVHNAANALIIDGVISGSGGLNLNGPGALRLDGSAPNTYTGTTAVFGGTLGLNHSVITNAAVTKTLFIGSGTVRTFQDGQIPNDAFVTIGGGGTLDTFGKLESIGKLHLDNGSAITTGAGKLILNDNVAMFGTGSAPATITGNLEIGDGDRVFDVGNTIAATELIIDGVISGGATANLILTGGGVTEFKGAAGNTYGGMTWVKDGTLNLATNTADAGVSKTVVIGDGVGAADSAVVNVLNTFEIPDAASLTVNADGRVNVATNFNEDVTTLNLNGGQVNISDNASFRIRSNGAVNADGTPGSVIDGTGTFTLLGTTVPFTVADGAAAADLTIAAKMTASGVGLVKQGAGTLVITGANASTGPTTVNAGSLVVDGSFTGNSAITVNGGFLRGTGAVADVTTTGGAVAPGSASGSTATFSTKSINLGGATFVVELGGAAAGQFDQLDVVGTVNLTNATLTAALSSGSGPGQQFRIINNDATDAVIGTFNGLAEGGALMLNGRPFAISYQGGDGNDVVLTDMTPNTLPTITDVANQTSSGSPVGPIGFTVNDAETAADALVVTSASSNQSLVPNANIVIGGSGASRTVTVTPAAGITGTATITLTVIDANGGTASDTFTVTVLPPNVNTFPTISDVGNQSSMGNPVGPLGFTVGDLETLAANLTVTATSSNPALIPNGTIVIGGSGASRTITLTPAAGQTGSATITLTVTDANGASVTDTFVVNVTAPVVPPTPQPFAAGTDAGGTGAVTMYNPDGSAKFNVTPFPGVSGGVRVAVGDVNGDGVADLIAGTGPGGPTHVTVIDGKTQAVLFNVDPFEASFTGGVYVAAGDLNGDGKADLVITPDEGGGPRARVFRGGDFQQIADFFGIEDTAFRGGARAAVGDLNGDGVGDLIVAAGFGGGPRVAAFDGSKLAGNGGPKLFPDILAFEPALRNGTFVTAGDLNGDGFAELIAGGGPGGGPRVTSFDGKQLTQNGQPVPGANFFAGDVNNRGGIRLAAKDLDGDGIDDLVTGAGTGAGSRVTSYSGASLAAGNPTVLHEVDAFPGFAGGVFVG